MNASGEVVVGYSYDPWGNILSVTGSMASTLGVDNPFRYRSYYYDTESGLYYLNSRYYDAKVCRFVNADSYVSTGQGFLGYDMYAYCLNNPVSYSDPAGNASVRIIIPSETEGAIIFQKICKNPQQIPLNRPSQKPDKISASGDTKNRIPPDHPDYKPPKGGPRWVKVPDSKKSGWLDSNGSIWIPDPNMHGGEGWVVQPKFGEHSHAYPGGGTRNHFVDVPPGIGDYLTVIGGCLLAGILIVDDFTVIGAVDDALIPAAAGMAGCGVAFMGKGRRCEICGEEYY